MNNPAERTRDKVTFVPNTDIYQEGRQLILLVDMPGVSENSIDVQLEKGILKINGCVKEPKLEGYRPIYQEYKYGDYERSFSLSNEIDSEKIEASINNGVLKLTLPIAEKQQARNIKVVSK